DHEAVALADEPLANDLLGAPRGLRRGGHGVAVGGVEEVDAGLGGAIEDREGGAFVRLVAEGHRPETELGHLESGLPHAAGLHGEKASGLSGWLWCWCSTGGGNAARASRGERGPGFSRPGH